MNWKGFGLLSITCMFVPEVSRTGQESRPQTRGFARYLLIVLSGLLQYFY